MGNVAIVQSVIRGTYVFSGTFGIQNLVYNSTPAKVWAHFKLPAHLPFSLVLCYV